jgi:hypothetical protein
MFEVLEAWDGKLGGLVVVVVVLVVVVLVFGRGRRCMHVVRIS